MEKHPKGWTTECGPLEPVRPEPPEKFLQKRKFSSFACYPTYDLLELKNVALPNDVSLEDVVITYNEVIEILEAGVMVTCEVKNTKYDKELKSYKNALKKYEFLFGVWQVEHDVWSAWTEGVKQEELNNALNDAEKLLRAHGRLK